MTGRANLTDHCEGAIHRHTRNVVSRHRPLHHSTAHHGAATHHRTAAHHCARRHATLGACHHAVVGRSRQSVSIDLKLLGQFSEFVSVGPDRIPGF